MWDFVLWCDFDDCRIDFGSWIEVFGWYSEEVFWLNNVLTFLKYVPDHNWHGIDELKVTATWFDVDETIEGSVLIEVTEVPEDPIITLPTPSLWGLENQPQQIKNISFADPDDPTENAKRT